MRVVLVFDTTYGANPYADLGDAFWLVESPDNRDLALKARQLGTTDPNSAVFVAPRGPPTHEDVAERVYDIEQHHPAWTVIEVIGANPTTELEAEIVAAGHTMTSESSRIAIKR